MLRRFRHFDTRIVIHRDPRLMPASRGDWGMLNIFVEGEQAFEGIVEVRISLAFGQDGRGQHGRPFDCRRRERLGQQRATAVNQLDRRLR